LDANLDNLTEIKGLINDSNKRLTKLKDFLKTEENDLENTEIELKNVQGDRYDEDQDLPMPRKKPKFYMHMQRDMYLKRQEHEKHEMDRLNKRPTGPEYKIITNSTEGQKSILKSNGYTHDSRSDSHQDSSLSPRPKLENEDDEEENKDSESLLNKSKLHSDGLATGKKMSDSLKEMGIRMTAVQTAIKTPVYNQDQN
jgi:hypothetical protein